MKLSIELERLILSRFPETRGKNGRYLRVVAGNSMPVAKSKPGWTEWKNGRARKYHRADYWAEVGADWIAAQYPGGVMVSALAGAPIVPIASDFGPPLRWPWAGVETFEPESEALYAD